MGLPSSVWAPDKVDIHLPSWGFSSAKLGFTRCGQHRNSGRVSVDTGQGAEVNG